MLIFTVRTCDNWNAATSQYHSDLCLEIRPMRLSAFLICCETVSKLHPDVLRTVSKNARLRVEKMYLLSGRLFQVTVGMSPTLLFLTVSRHFSAVFCISSLVTSRVSLSYFTVIKVSILFLPTSRPIATAVSAVAFHIPLLLVWFLQSKGN